MENGSADDALDARLREPGTEATVDALLDTVRSLLEEGNAWDQSFNLRGFGIAALVGVVLWLSITLGFGFNTRHWLSPAGEWNEVYGVPK